MTFQTGGAGRLAVALAIATFACRTGRAALDIREGKGGGVEIVNGQGDQLVSIDGVFLSYGELYSFANGTVTRTAAGFDVSYKPPKSFPSRYAVPEVRGRFKRQNGCVSVEFAVGGVSTNDPFNADLCMIRRRCPKGTARVAFQRKLGYWVRDPKGGQPWEEKLGQVESYTNSLGGVRYAYAVGRGSNQSWQDDEKAHLQFARSTGVAWTGGFLLMDMEQVADNETVALAAAGRKAGISLSTERTYNWFEGDAQGLGYLISVVNSTGLKTSLRLSHRTRDYDGKIAEQGETVVRLAPYGRRAVPVTFEAKAPRGLYFVEASVSDESGVELAFARTNIAKLPPYRFKATPETSVFGISAYWAIPDEESVQRLMDRMGVMWVRDSETRKQHPPRLATFHSHWKQGLKGAEREKWIAKKFEACREQGNRHWEFCNELNMSTMGIGMAGGGIGKAVAASDYVDWVRDIVRIRRERGFEDVRLLSVGVAGFDKAFYDKIYELGAWDLLDGICLHPGRGNMTVDYPFSRPELPCGVAEAIEDPTGKNDLSHSNYWNFLGSVRGCLDLIRRYGQKPLWLTEIYTPTYPNSWWEDSLRDSADNTLLTYCFIKADGVRCGMYYQLFDSVWYDKLGINHREREYYFGLLNRDLSFKPALMAYCAAAEFLDTAIFDGWFECRRPTTHAMRFKVPGGVAAVLWDRSEGLRLNKDHGEGAAYVSPEPWKNRWKVEVPVVFKAKGRVTVMDAIGRTRDLVPKDGLVTVPASGSVQIVRGRCLEIK